jgi:hypothetical protein
MCQDEARMHKMNSWPAIEKSPAKFIHYNPRGIIELFSLGSILNAFVSFAFFHTCSENPSSTFK